MPRQKATASKSQGPKQKINHTEPTASIAPSWRKSSHSEPNETERAEAGRATTRVVAVRDSKDPNGDILTFETGEWHTLLTNIRTGAHDLNP
ncbi:DUF397 domain-containing protein [Actinomadura sp. KC216]|uniref:DUF397 domain-containing protein n=1 Tax=Actinomadura sp. KC216 TaxID=2530370 RepID=UPI001FB58A00|nr:DUF397 domain-containing protein [Actinomadura sp. KC216]